MFKKEKSKLHVPVRFFETQKEVPDNDAWQIVPRPELSDIKKMIEVDTWKALTKVGSDKSRAIDKAVFSSDETVLLKERKRMDSR